MGGGGPEESLVECVVVVGKTGKPENRLFRTVHS